MFQLIAVFIIGGAVPSARDHEEIMFELVNMHRVMMGYDHLQTDGMFNQYTRGIAEDMVTGEEPFDHSNARFRAKQITQFLDWYAYGEVLGVASGTGESLEYAVFRKWMISLAHKQVIENGNYNMLGVGFAQHEEKYLFVMIFLYVV